MDTTVPKIHLESTKDVAFLKQQFKQTIRVILSTLDASMQEIALANNTSLEQVQQEAAAKLDKWLEHLFQLAGNGIEINGLDYKDAMDNKQQYMQFEENLRINVDEMYNQANQQLVQVSRVRKQAPLDCNMLVKDSLSILDTFSTEAIVTDDSQVENKNNITDTDSGIQKPLSQNDYETCLTLARQLQTVLDLPELLKKVSQTSQLLDDLEIPLTKQSTTPKRRATVLGQPDWTPKRARAGLLQRINHK